MEFFSGSEEVDFMSHLVTSNVSTFQDSWTSLDEPSLSISDNNMPAFSLQNTCSDAIFPTFFGQCYLSVSCSSLSQNHISVVPFIPPTDHNSLSPNDRKHSCNEADVHTSLKKPKFSKNLVSKDGVEDDVARNGKKRASNDSSTDSQSAYAKKRRERINERLRILQNLVPNGTKVDISTMLEEAVEYVKFLQLQIKLLSSDDLWMYAPIAYNGLELGLDVKLPSPR